MTNERQLMDIQINEQLWAEATDEMFRERWETHDQGDHYGRSLARAVITGEMDITDLRRLRARSNRLDQEAVEISDGNIENLDDADYFEATARRIANQATSYALESVKSRRLRFKQKRQIGGLCTSSLKGYT